MKIPLLIILGISLFLTVAFGLVAVTSGHSNLTDGVMLIAGLTALVSGGLSVWLRSQHAASQ